MVKFSIYLNRRVFVMLNQKHSDGSQRLYTYLKSELKKTTNWITIGLTTDVDFQAPTMIYTKNDFPCNN